MANKRTGIICNVRCVSNKVDQAKDDVRSICLNFDIRGEDADGDMKNLGKGNNLNINNLTPVDYVQLCRAFGVSKIDDGTPIIAELFSATQHEDKEAWTMAMARKDKSVSEDQADVTQFEGSAVEPDGAENKAVKPEDIDSVKWGTISPKQAKYIHDMTGKLDSVQQDSVVVDTLKSAGVGTIEELSKEDASALIKTLKASAKKEKGDAKE